MNLALHGFLLHVILSTFNLKYGFRLCSAGEPGYLDFDNLPETNFSCQGKVIGGYYADVEAGCQMFHVCTIGQKDEIMDIKFLCLNGTVFDQETRVCERVDEVDCSKSERFYNLNLELYGNNAVTLSLHEEEDNEDFTDLRDDNQQQQLHMTSARPSTTSTTTTTTSRPSQPSTASASNAYQQHPTGYPQHFQPRPAFSSAPSGQSNSHFDDKNGGYHHQYIYHNDERNNNQATSYQLFSNQGVSSTTPTPPVHQQVRYSSTANPQVIHNDPATASPLQYHVQPTSSTIQTLLNSNSNNPSLINPLFHNHGISSTTEQFNVHNNNPREIAEYQDDSEEDEKLSERRPLEPVQSTNTGKISKLSISPVPQSDGSSQTKNSQGSQQQRISINYLPTQNPTQTTISTFYPTQRPTSQKPPKNQNSQQVTQHIHIPPPPSIPQLKPHQITINLPPPDIHRIVQNPSPLLPSQSRVIVTAKASVSDEAGRPLNASQLITLPLPTIPTTYDDYKEGDESFDPFYRDVPKIRNNRRILFRNIEPYLRTYRRKRSTDEETNEESSEEIIFDAEIKDITDLKANLPIIKAILFGLPIPEDSESVPDTEKINSDDLNDTNLNPEVAVSDHEEYVPYKHSETQPNPLIHSFENLTSRINENDRVNSEIPRNVEIPRAKAKSPNTRRGNNRQNSGHPRSYLPTAQRQKNVHRTVIDHESMDTKSEDTVQLFSRETDGDNSVSRNESSLTQVDVLEKTNSTVHNKTDVIKQEVLQTRSSSNSNKSNRRKNLSNESVEASEDYVPRRNSRLNKPKSSRYYDEYDASESIEVGSRQRVNRIRQRPKERRIVNYRNDYADEDDIEDEEYDEDINRNRKNTYRRGSQSRRIPNRTPNRNYDYEDDIEVDEKPRVRTKAISNSSRSRGRPYHESELDDRRRRPERRRKNGKRRPSISEDEILPRNRTEQSNSKTLKNASSPEVLGQIPKEKSEENNREIPKKHYNTLEKDEDYLDRTEHYVDEYNEPVDDIPNDYLEYADLREHTSRGGVSRQRNRNRFDDEIEPVPRRKSHRRNKSRKFNEDIELITEKSMETTESERIEFTTIADREEPTTIIVPTEYLVPDEIVTPQDYNENITEETILKLNKNSASITATPEISSTEGVLKYTDDLPRAEKKSNTKGRNNEKLNVTINEEEYVDDNYEPMLYSQPNFEVNLPAIPQVIEENNKKIIMNQLRTENVFDRNQTEDTTRVELDSEEDYYEAYEDELDSTTTEVSSKENDDTDTTTGTIITHSTSVPILTSTTPVVTSSSSSTTQATTTTSTTTTTTTTTPAPTTTTSASTTSTTSTPSSTLPTTRNKATSKFFKPISFRKNYAYNTPSTTPNAVVIRRGPSSTKATKSPPSYNDVGVKPLIRRLPLLQRTTTTTSEATIVKEEIPDELPTQSVDNTNKYDDEKNTQYLDRHSPSAETVTNYSEANTIKSNEVTTENFGSITTNVRQQFPITPLSTISPTIINQVLQSKDHRVTNEIRRQNFDSNDSNNVPQRSDDSIAETSKAESTTSGQQVSKIDTTTKATNYKVFGVQTTTARTFRPSERRKLELTSIKTLTQKSNQGPKQVPGFNCLEKEMYRFYGDVRDCRLFHYCSPGFTARQVLDFRFVCEESTIFDEESQSCKHDVPNPKCVKRVW